MSIRATFKAATTTVTSVLDSTTKLVTVAGSSIDMLEKYVSHAKENQKYSHHREAALRKLNYINDLSKAHEALESELANRSQASIDFAMDSLNQLEG